MTDLSDARRPHPVVCLLYASADTALAEALRTALGRIGRTRKRSISAHRLTRADPSLRERADHLVFLLSPAARDDPAVGDLLADWLEATPRKPVLFVLASGETAYDRSTGLFTQASGVPAALRDRFPDEPLFVDFGTGEVPTRRPLGDAEFRRAVGQLATALYGLPSRDQLDGDDIRAHLRRRRFLAGSIVAVLVCASLGAYGAVAYTHRREEADRERAATEAAQAAARARTMAAVGQRLAGLALKPDDLPPELRMLLGAQAHLLGARQAGPTLFSLLREFNQERPPLENLMRTEDQGTPWLLGPDGGVLTQAGHYFPPGGRSSHRVRLPPFDDLLALSPGGRWAVVASPEKTQETIRTGALSFSCATRTSGGCPQLLLADLSTGKTRLLPRELWAARALPRDIVPFQGIGPEHDVFTATGRYLLSWNALTHELSITPADGSGPAVRVPLPGTLLDVRPDGDRWAYAVTDRELVRLRLPDGHVESRLEVPTAGADAAAVRQQGPEVVVARRGRLDFVPVGRPGVRYSVETELSRINRIVIDPTGRFAVATGANGGALVDVTDGTLLARGAWGVLGTAARFEDEDFGSGLQTAFTAGGRELVLRPGLGRVGWGSPVFLWSTDVSRWYDGVCALAGRALSDQEWRQYVGLDEAVPRACRTPKAAR